MKQISGQIPDGSIDDINMFGNLLVKSDQTLVADDAHIATTQTINNAIQTIQSSISKDFKSAIVDVSSRRNSDNSSTVLTFTDKSGTSKNITIDVSDKIGLVANPTENNIVTLAADGSIKDSTIKIGSKKSEDIIKKCPFHLDLNVHTHIKGFTFDCKNIRYALHLESGGTGYATKWEVSNCIFKWGGRADCIDYADKTTVPVFGCGHSFGEVGLIENCKIIAENCTIGYQSHDNADNSDFGLPIKVGSKITFKDCDFGGTEIQARTLKGAYADTPNVLTIDSCVNISAINKLYAAPATKCDWTVVENLNKINEK